MAANSKSSQKNARAARRAKIEEARRQERARDRRNRLLTIIASAVVIAAIVGGAGYLVATSEDDDTDSGNNEQPPAAVVEGERTWGGLTQNHVTEDVDYPQTPPVGGDHNAVWMNCEGDVYDAEIPNENAVHSLEHGAVWVTYNDAAAEADIQTLADRVSDTPYSLMSPLPAQEAPITLSAWGHQLTLESADDPRAAEFFDTYVQGDQTPEPGASCGGGLTE